jgi:uncharacterized protein (DUF983 family)
MSERETMNRKPVSIPMPITSECGRINGKCPKCSGSLQEHFIHEVASLMWCGKCYTAFLDEPDNEGELTELASKCKHGPAV